MLPLQWDKFRLTVYPPPLQPQQFIPPVKQRADQWPVPLPAFRESVVNAVAHRDYAILGSRVLVEVFDDRLVVASPGAVPNHQRPKSVLAGGTPRSRNEAVASFQFDLGLMERRGSGYPRMTRAMRQFNGTVPHLEQDWKERWVRVTLWRTPPEAVTPTDAIRARQ